MRCRYFVCLAMLLLAWASVSAAQNLNAGGIADGSGQGWVKGCVNFQAGDTAGGQTQNHGFDLSNLDRSVSPCDDFFKFAGGGWIKNNPIPAAYPRWGSFNELANHNQDVLHGILEEAVKDKTAKPGSNWQKIGDFYGSCMDETAIVEAGTKPLQPEFDLIAAIGDLAGLQAEIARMHQMGIRAVFAFHSEQDQNDSTQVIAGADQGGLGLPERDYYTRDDAKSVKLREQYAQHITNMFKLLGDDDATAAAEAKTVVQIETSLAKASMTRVELRDPDKTYHKLPLAEVSALTPHFDWNKYFVQVGSPVVSVVDVGQPEFFKVADAQLAAVPLADWKVYLRWHLVHSAAAGLPAKFEQEDFDFYSRTLQGTQEMLPRWRRCVASTDRQLGEALGQYYVQRAFPPEAKAKATQMVKNLVAALRADLATLDWMSPETRKQAIAKLDAINLKIGYPSEWRDYSAFQVTKAPYAENVIAGSRFGVAWNLSKIGKPVERQRWNMTPPTVNAYYSPVLNEIVFPAGIMQPPFYDPNRDDAMNYGGMGAVIGHEMTHGFDDQGAKFDAKGNRSNWWTAEDLKNFQERGDCIQHQFDEYEVETGLHENGKLVEGESIADFGGLTISYAAFRKTLEGKPEPAPIDGFTADQRFFIGWAQIWKGSNRPETARLRVNTDPHPLEQFRTDGPLSNMPVFRKTFGCSDTSAMVRPEAKRCRIW
jgi:putative endopeptidase